MIVCVYLTLLIDILDEALSFRLDLINVPVQLINQCFYLILVSLLLSEFLLYHNLALAELHYVLLRLHDVSTELRVRLGQVLGLFVPHLPGFIQLTSLIFNLLIAVC